MTGSIVNCFFGCCFAAVPQGDVYMIERFVIGIFTCCSMCSVREFFIIVAFHDLASSVTVHVAALYSCIQRVSRRLRWTRVYILLLGLFFSLRTSSARISKLAAAAAWIVLAYC